MLIIKLGEHQLTYDDRNIETYKIDLDEDSYDGLMLSLSKLKDFYNKDKKEKNNA